MAESILVHHGNHRIVRYSRSDDGWYAIQVIVLRGNDTSGGNVEIQLKSLRLSPQEIKAIYRDTQLNKEEE
jgi:hypothetical protein